MKNLALGVIFSMFIMAGSVASVAADLNLPGEKKKKCKADKKECKSDSKKSCCPSNGEKKDCSKKSEAQ